MAFDFPTAPAVDDAYTDTVTGVAYKFDGEKWLAGGGGATLPPADAVYLPLAGGTMSGAIQLPATQPLAQTESTHKQYVDTAISAKALYQGVWQVAANSPDITPATANPLHSYSWIANTVDPNLPETAPAALPGIGGLLISSSDTVIWNATTSVYELVRSPASVSGDFVEVTGDTMTGVLNFVGNGASPARVLSFKKNDGAVTDAYINLVVSAAEEGVLEFWTANGGYSSAMAFKTTIAGAPGIFVSGDASVGTLTSRGALSTNGFATINGGASFADNVSFTQDNDGIIFYGGGRVTKVSGGGMCLYNPTSETPWKICNNSGGNCSNIATSALTRSVEDQIADAVGPLLAKIAALEARLAKAKL